MQYNGSKPDADQPAIRGLQGLAGEATSAQRNGLFNNCRNPNCRNGWLRAWRRRSAPMLEGGWTCSPACTSARVTIAVRRELEGRREDPAVHRHRIPLGLVMLEQGWINALQLRQALRVQKASGHGRLGHWLVRQQGVQEQLVTRALSLQWNCPVLALDSHDPDAMAAALPRLFVDAFAALPLRVAGGKILYLAFEEQIDRVLALSLERMLSLRVEAGLMRGSLFHTAHDRLLMASYPKTELIETTTEASLVRVLTRALERSKPVDSRLVRVHDCLWLRMWLTRPPGLSMVSEVEDVVCTLAPS